MWTSILLISASLIFFLFLFLFFYIYGSIEDYTQITNKEELKYGKDATSKIPNIIWGYWHDSKLPPAISECIETWQKYNPSYTINIVTDDTLHKFLPDFNILSIKHNDCRARVSDYIRLNLLKKYGGIYMDCSIVCTESLGWINAYQKNTDCDVVMYYINGFTSNITYPVGENWFIASIPNSELITLWLDEFNRINDFDTVSQYLDDCKSKNVDFQKIDNPTYLRCHIALQCVLQKQYTPSMIKKQIQFIKAEQGPFLCLSKSNWDDEICASILCKSNNSLLKTPIIKFRGGGYALANNFGKCKSTLFRDLFISS